MLARLTSCGVFGVDAFLVSVEVDVSSGLPAFNIVGLPDTAVKEARERVRASVKNSGFSFPDSRITVNLAPAALKKAGPSFDLPIALGLLAATEQIKPSLSDVAVVGELELSGRLRPTPGVLAAAIAARQSSLRGLLVPRANLAEAYAVSGLSVWAAGTLYEAAQALAGQLEPAPPPP